MIVNNAIAPRERKVALHYTSTTINYTVNDICNYNFNISKVHLEQVGKYN